MPAYLVQAQLDGKRWALDVYGDVASCDELEAVGEAVLDLREAATGKRPTGRMDLRVEFTSRACPLGRSGPHILVDSKKFNSGEELVVTHQDDNTGLLGLHVVFNGVLEGQACVGAEQATWVARTLLRGHEEAHSPPPHPDVTVLRGILQAADNDDDELDESAP